VYENIVLTAAHCVNRYDATSLAVVVGIHNILTPDAKNTFLVTRRYYHDQFNSLSLEKGNDIAILVLEKNVTLGQTIGLACLPSSAGDSTNVINKQTIATGWLVIHDFLF